MNRRKGYKINDKEYFVLDDSDKVSENTEIVEMELFTPRKVKKGKNSYISKTVKHPYTTKTIFDMEDNSMDPVKITVRKVRNEDSGLETINLELKEMERGGKKIVSRLSKTKAYKLIKNIHRIFKRLRLTPKVERLLPKFSAESRLIMAILSSPEYSFVYSDLTEMGMTRSTANSLIKNLIKKGLVKILGRRGKANLYTFTLTRDEMILLFGMEIYLDKIDELKGEIEAYRKIIKEV